LPSKRLAAIAAAVLVVVLGAVAIAAPARPAYAHAALVRANPANNETLRRAPARVVLNFSEGVERKLTQIQVTNKDSSARFDDGPTAFDDADPTFASVGVKTLDPGLYFVKWSNVSSVDGHGLKGAYPFIVLNSDGTFPAGVTLDNAAATSEGQLLPSNVDIILKWITLLALATIVGAGIFLLVVLRPAAKFLDDEPHHAAMDAAERWLVNLAHVLLPLAFIAAAFLILRTVNRFETDTGLWSYLTTVRTGQYRGLQLILIAIALAGGDLLFLGGSERKRMAGLVVLISAGTAALLTASMVSHAATGQGKFWSTASDFAHVVASSTWLGALVMLPPLLRRRGQALEESEGFLFLANAFDRFSVVAGISVIVVLATGTFNALVEIPNPHAMLHTAYGKVLLAKLILLAPLLAVAGLNAFVLKPRLVNVIDGLYQEGGAGTEPQRAAWSRQLATLQRVLPITVIAEIALVVAVFAAVGVLTQAATAKGEIAQNAAASSTGAKFSQPATVGDFKVTLEVSPNRVGINQYDLSIQKPDGTPATTVTFARLRFNYDDVQNAVSPSEITLNKFADGDYRGAGAYFTQPGNWRAEATVRRSDGDDLSHIFVLPVGRAQVTAKSGGAGAYELPFKVFNWNEVAGAFLALGGAVIILYRKQLRWLQQPGYRIGITVATALMLGGAVLVFGVQHGAPTNATAGNPVKPTSESIARGKTLFQQNCLVCHGIDGRGDGPGAAELSPAPTDFRLHMPLHTDPQFYSFIANGYPGSAMPQFGKAISETDIWNLVNYLRNAFTDAPTQ
jgi:copper transport protein